MKVYTAFSDDNLLVWYSLDQFVIPDYDQTPHLDEGDYMSRHKQRIAVQYESGVIENSVYGHLDVPLLETEDYETMLAWLLDGQKQ